MTVNMIWFRRMCLFCLLRDSPGMGHLLLYLLSTKETRHRHIYLCIRPDTPTTYLLSFWRALPRGVLRSEGLHEGGTRNPHLHIPVLTYTYIYIYIYIQVYIYKQIYSNRTSFSFASAPAGGPSHQGTPRGWYT